MVPKPIWLVPVFAALVSCGRLGGRDSAVITAAPGDLVDRSFLTDQPCAPPCWHGLEPGTSTTVEVEQVMRGLEFLDVASIRERSATYADRALQPKRTGLLLIADCIGPEGRNCVGLLIIDGVLIWIEEDIEFPLSFEEVVVALGQPDFLRITYTGVDQPQCQLAMVWRSSRLSVLGGIVHDALQRCEAMWDGGAVSGGLSALSIRYDRPEFFEDIGLSDWYFEWPGFAQ